MTDEQMLAIGSEMTKLKAKWTKHRDEVYACLIDLAELEDDELTENKEHNADCALETIIRYGSCADNAEAMKLYTHFIMLTDLLEG